MNKERIAEIIIGLPLWFTLLPAAIMMTHYDMMRNNCSCKTLKKATYREVKSKMLQYEWQFDPLYPRSLFTESSHTEIHASMFQFDGVGYVLTLYGYIRASLLQRKIRKTLPRFLEYRKPYVN